MTSWPQGPVQGTSARVPPTAARKASTVPSPPSATGMAQISASGSSRNISSDAMRQISAEDSVPLKESGISTYFAMVSAPFRKKRAAADAAAHGFAAYSV